MSHSLSHDHEKCISEAINMAERLCISRSVKLTPIRRKVLELIWESHKAVKAYDLLDQIKPLNYSAKPATVYRALDFLMSQGLIHKVESLNAYVGCSCSGRQHEQLLLICDQCHEIEERAAFEVMHALSSEIKRAGFSISYKSIEIHGTCAGCASSHDQSA
jgi:Fur family zinc uptake transcriptional regulator